jgi:hypothetical protein
LETVRLFVGFDQREAAAYHVFCQSVIERASCPVAFYPVASNMLGGFDGQQDGTNAFIFSRYLVPLMCNFSGWAIFADGDMVVDCDIAELWAHRQFNNIAVSVVKHDYKTRNPRKYIGTPIENDNVDYPRKNWSSVMLWNCGHFANRCLTPGYVRDSGGEHMHRFKWLRDSQIGALPSDWNHLVGEDPPGPAKLDHYTLGVSGIRHYADDSGSWRWHSALIKSLECAGEDPVHMVRRAQERIGELHKLC